MKPKCMFCRHEPPKPAKKGTRFCSQNCAAAYAHAIVNESDSGWCNVCNQWVDDGTHINCEGEIIQPETDT